MIKHIRSILYAAGVAVVGFCAASVIPTLENVVAVAATAVLATLSAGILLGLGIVAHSRS